MDSAETATPLPGHACQVFRAEDLFVTSGANMGDGLGEIEDVCAGDSYVLDEAARPLRMMLAQAPGGTAQTVGAGSEIGQPGDPVTLAARYTLMTPAGDRLEVLLLRHRAQGRTSTATLFALPLSPMAPRVEYALIKVDEAPVATRLSDLVCVSFARGTHIALGSGAQRPIEALVPGDRVLTRDHGAQPIRWIGRATLRAVGSFAPVVIGRGALGNAGDLIVSQHHRMFLYQRDRKPGLRTAEVLVQAKHLVDGVNIFLREGGYIDYFSLIFDAHEIIYAEGIPAESLMVNEATLSRLPEDMAEEVKARFPGLSQDQHFGTEAGRQVLDEIGRASLLRRQRAGG